MHPLQNLAGHDLSIFLFRFEIGDNGITFVLNEAISPPTCTKRSMSGCSRSPTPAARLSSGTES
ncbi:MAG: hypothetical protein WA970_25765 [Gammaproteobacteria bacterium]